MSENVPPTPAAAANANAPTTTPSKAPSTAVASTETRGLPYYESLRRTLRDTLARKRALDRTLQSLEESIHREESRYLEETSSAGNIVKGFDNYIKASAGSTIGGGGGGGTISGSAVGGTGRQGRKAVVSEGDRVFSRSSVGWAGREDGVNGNGGTASGQGSSVSTPVGTPGVDGNGGGNDGKRKKKGRLEEGETRVKRQKISFGPRKGED